MFGGDTLHPAPPAPTPFQKMLASLLALLPLVSYAQDVIVYGATPGGIQTALSAASKGLKILLIHPLPFVGGLMSGGLGATDKGNPTAIGGASQRFFTDVCSHFRSGPPPCFDFPPHAARDTFTGYLAASPGITLLLNTTLVSATKAGTLVTSITVAPTEVVESGTPIPADALTSFTAPYFADGSYEGDLIAAAGITFAVGREGVSEFNESHAGVLAEPSSFGSHQFKVPVDTRWPNGTLLPMLEPLSPTTPGAVGSGDGKVQAYNFRLTMTTNQSNWRPFPAPRAYDSAQWELARRWLKAANVTSFTSLMNLSPVGEGVTDTNNNGPISTDVIGASWDYPNATPAQRRVIWDKHYQYTASFFHFLQNDPDIHASIRTEARQWGLTLNEFVESNGWTPQLYVREGRRMRGVYVFNQMDRQYNLTKPDSIGLFSYNIDSHNAQRYEAAVGQPLNEGDFELYGGPRGQIPYRVITPVKEEATNLLAPVPLSATHMGYGTLRLEPQYMIIGQSAGIALAMAFEGKMGVQEVDIGALQEALRALGQKIDL